ncbi:MAG: DUF1559 domain-containing protein, partial [Planctomycetaceae bacterium]|nr:DUF1559 domain-containing protein [Planctomycetaceae bacterium]
TFGSGGRRIKETSAVAVSGVFRGSVAVGTVDSGDSEFDPKKCLDIRDSKGDYDATAVTTLRRDNGRIWTDAGIPFTWINTILPPNSPTCLVTNNEEAGGIVPPSSFHNGGTNCVNVDGSVMFVSDSVSAGPLASPTNCVLKGASPFGVWGAYGSINGGETVKL